MTPPTEKPFEPTPGQVEEVAAAIKRLAPSLKQFYLSSFSQRQQILETVAKWHLAELSTLRSQVEAANQIADRFRLQIETLNKALSHPRLQLEQPCGCVLCVCDHSESCTGCGAKFCGKPDCVMKVNEQGRLYEDAPSYVQLRSQVDALKAQVVVKDEALKFYADASKWQLIQSADDAEFSGIAFDDEETNGSPWTVASDALTQPESKC